jgi:hypothetical protein
MKRETKKQQLIDYMSDGQWKSSWNLNKITFAYSQAMSKLKRQGYMFESEPVKDNPSHWIYRMTRMPEDIPEIPAEAKHAEAVEQELPYEQ